MVLEDMTDQQLAAVRLDIENQISNLRIELRTIVDEVNKRQRVTQLKARYGVAAALVLKVMPADEIIDKLKDLVADGTLKEQSTIANVDGVADTLLTRKPLGN